MADNILHQCTRTMSRTKEKTRHNLLAYNNNDSLLLEQIKQQIQQIECHILNRNSSGTETRIENDLNFHLNTNVY